MPWTQKYAPKDSTEIQGQDTIVETVRDFLVNYKTKKKKTLLLYGPPGCGKTSIVHALAKELDLELIEVNASDSRNADAIEQVIGAAAKQMSLFMRPKVILIDEVDGVAGNQDRGGLPTLVSIIQASAFPIICTANNPFDSKFSPLRKVSEMVQLNTLAYTSIAAALKRICDQEGITYDVQDLKSLARRMAGDLRGAITDLQTITTGKKTLDKSSLDELSERKQTESMLKALVKVFKTTDANVAITAFDDIAEDLNAAQLWVDENLPKEYIIPLDLYRAYDAISKADVFNGRIRRWQHWRFLVYINMLLTAGVALAKDEKYSTFVQYKPTTRILKLWQAKMKKAKKKAIAEKMGRRLHASQNEIIKSLPFFKTMMQDDDLALKMIEEFDLDKDDVAYLKK